MDVMIYKKKIKQKFSIPSSQKISIYSLGDTDELAMSLGKLVLDGTKKLVQVVIDFMNQDQFLKKEILVSSQIITITHCVPLGIQQ